MTIGIYCLKFNGTNNVYIGQSRRIEKRLTQHLYLLQNNLGANKLQEAYNRYGKPVLEIILECSLTDLNENEANAIEIFDSFNNGFNSRSEGLQNNYSYTFGEKHHRCKYSDLQLSQVLFLLVSTEYNTHREISDITKVGISTIEGISSKTYHIWLKDKFPDQYIKLEKHRVSGQVFRKSIVRECSRVISPLGVCYEITNLKGFCKEHGLTSGHLRDVLNGKAHSHRGWKRSN